MCVYISIYRFITDKASSMLKTLLCLYISWQTVAEGNLKVSSSIATTLRCRGGCYTFPWIAPLTLDPYLIMINVKHDIIKYIFFESLVWLDLRLKSSLPEHMANTITILPNYNCNNNNNISIYIYIYIYI